MKIGQQLQFIVINKQAHSLYSLIADEHYHSTSLGRGTWKKLIGSQASLQRNCNREGFNVICKQKEHSKARIGIVTNNENDCYSCDSRIGFGTGGMHDYSNTCGNEAMHYTDNGHKHIKAMGYILVQWERNLSHNINNLLYRWDDDFSNCEVALLDLDLCQYITVVLPWINLHGVISADL